MNGIELKVAREVLGFSNLTEAARELGKASSTAWKDWEGEKYPINPKVVETIKGLLKKRQEMLQHSGSLKTVIYYTASEHCGSVIDLRLSQAVARQVAIDNGVKVVKFAPESYYEWLDGAEDSPQKRQEWAESI